MSSTSPPGDTPLPAPPSSSVLAGDPSDTAPVLPPLDLSFHSSAGLGLGDVHGSSPPPPNANTDDPVSNTGLNAEPSLVKSNMSFSDASISHPITNLQSMHSSSSSSPAIPDLRSIPIPVPVTSAGTNSQVNPARTFVMAPSKSMMSDLGAEQGNGIDSSGIDIDSLPPEVTKADLFIAPDGSFVQTSSALAARELKKCYDKILRVGHRDQVVRSPYAITAVEDESGAKVFRISRRDDDSAPLPSDHSISQPQAQNQPITNTATTSSRRKARLSVQDFLPSGMFKPNNNAAAAGSTNLNQAQNGSNMSSSPVTNSSPSSPPPVTRRKLRKTRSNSDLHSRVTLSPSNSTDTHSQAPSQQHHTSRYTYGYDTYSVYPPFEIRDELTAGADAFSQVLGWVSELATDTGAIASSSRRKGKSMSGAAKGLPILIGNADDSHTLVNTHDEADLTPISAPATAPAAPSSRSRSSSAAGLASVQNAATNLPRRPSVSTSAALSNVGVANNGVINNLNNSFHNYIVGEPWRIASPFGENVKYTTPLRVSNGNSGLDSDPTDVAENSLPLMEDLLSQPPQSRELREMQSFESGLTARIGDIGIGNGQERSPPSFERDTALGTASSEPGTPKFAKEEMKNSVHVSLGDYSFPSDSNTWFHFSTRVFDVIQTYKGLPLPSALSSAPPTGATIKITATESPNPKDDPRFVIWGELHGDSGDTNAASRDDASMSVSISGGSQTESNTQSSHTHSTSSAVPLPPRKRSNARQPDSLPSTNPEAAPRTVIIAATVERWIAQLTSELDYDELLNFLLTYRTYITPVDLCHLLICRFYWALEKPTSKQDEMVRRIIRVRTFIAIRYWLLTFFREDFLPNSTLCTLFTAWLNSLFRDLSTRGDGGGDALSIVRKLKKVVRECKAAHARRGTDAVASSTDLTTDDSDVDLDFSNVYYVRRPSHSDESGTGSISSSTCIDVGMSFDGAAKFGVYPTLSAKTGPATFTALATAHVPFTSPDTLLLSQPLSKTILDHVKSPKPGIDAPLAQAAGIGTLPLPSRSGAPYHSSAISRAFVNTIGRLGRWKRVLNVRSSAAVGGSSYAANMAIGYIPQIEVRNLSPESPSNPFPAESSFSSASGITRDPRVGRETVNPAEELLHVKGGVEEYLKMLKLGPVNSEAERTASIALSKEGILAPEQNGTEGLSGNSMSINNASTDDSREAGAGDDHPYPPRPPGLDIPSFSVVSTTGSFSDSDENSAGSVIDSPPAFDDQLGTDKQITVESIADPVPTSALSYSGSEQGESREDRREVEGTTYEDPVQGASDTSLKKEWVPDTVSLDDYDLSTSESDLSSVDGQNGAEEDVGVGVGIRKGKTTRRLPLRREFQFVRGSGGSVSSLGVRSRSSFVLSVRSGSGSRERESERIDSVASAATRKQSRNDGSPTSSNRSSHSSSLSSQRTTSQAGTSHVGKYTSHFQQWQIELISDDEEEAGDAEAALRRLEGQIDVERQREKDMKVGRWLKTARAKAPDGIDFIAEGSRSRRVGERKYSVSAESVGSMESGISLSVESVGYKDEEGDFSVNLNPTMTVASTPTITEHGTGSNAQGRDRSGSVSSMASISSSSGYVKSGASVSTSADTAYMRTSTIAVHAARHSAVLSSKRADMNMNTIITFKPSSVSNATAAALSMTTNSSASVPMPGHAPSAPLSSPSSTVPYAYRSFILLHRSELLAQQFMIIEADLFKRIKFEEIISHQWGQAIEDVNVRDWVSFVKERARLKNAGATFGGGSDSNGGAHSHSTSILHTTAHPKLSSILALRARFDLVVNFVASEVVLTHPVERVILIEKIIRIAWKMYLHNNFNTLVAIVSGLQTRWVNKAMGKKWNKVGMWEQRIFEDLKRFASREGEFKYIRNATAALIDQRPLSSGAEGGTISSPSVTGNSFDRDKEKEHSSPQGNSQQQRQPFCLPFLGAYLAQLYAYEKLPDFIDPTAPTEPVLIDISTGTLSPPSHSEVFFNLQPLPEDIALEPLINVHKQRLIAGVIKAFVGAQHLAACVPFGVDVKSYQRCFRIRSLETEVLQSLLGREAGAG